MTYEQFVSKLEQAGIEYTLLHFSTTIYVQVGRFYYRFDEQGNSAGGWIRHYGEDWRGGMAEVAGPVERAYLVSVEDLREICIGLTDGNREYKLTREDEKKVAIFYNDGPDDLNAVCFTFPIIRNLCLSRFLPLRLDEGALMVCLHIYTAKQVKHGLYFDDDRLLCDTN